MPFVPRRLSAVVVHRWTLAILLKLVHVASPMTTTISPRYALLSVSDKAGIVSFARGLRDLGFGIISSGGTARTLADAGIEVTECSAYTGAPEVMGGRVKTLHPRVHGGILARAGEAGDFKALAEMGGHPISVVCVNLYPFAETVASGGTLAACVEQIDIGGPAMLRAAAKNFSRVYVVADVADYSEVLDALRAEHQDGAPEAGLGAQARLRRQLSQKAFAHTASYDSAIAAYLAQQLETEAARSTASGAAPESPLALPAVVSEARTGLRYGENPHQAAAVLPLAGAHASSLALAASLNPSAKALSYNNYLDADAALAVVREFTSCAAVVVKHCNPCGVARAETPSDAFVRAREADALSAFGGIAALNRTVDASTARRMVETFLEVVLAPAFSDEALEVLRTKKNLRVLQVRTEASAVSASECQVRSIDGGLLLQSLDAPASGDTLAQARCVTARPPSAEEVAQLDMAWRVCKQARSNAIVLVADAVTVGVGAGQMSRVQSVEIAVAKAGTRARGAVLASDAFFPFPDGVEAAAAAGVTAVVQPGGSVKDDEVIRAADAAGIAMVFTGKRHFRH